MLRILLLVIGVLLLSFQQYIQAISIQTQFITFLLGIVFLGVPHGAADLLVATKNATVAKQNFSNTQFFLNYIGRLLLFAIILWLFPLFGNLLFIFFAAYHFGETDLHQFKTNGLTGKLFVISYGLVILGVILLNHFEEVRPMLQQFNAGIKHQNFINWLDVNRYTILSFLGVLFFATTFIYFATNQTNQQQNGQFLIQFALLLFILYNLPMVLGFTFYFVVWHSVLSLKNIIGYLYNGGLFGLSTIIKQVTFYSLLAMAGIVFFGFAGFMFVNNDTMMVYIFLGLAVLTAPHMQIMQEMYNSVRLGNKSNFA